MNRFLIFDMDGVLVNSEPFHKEVLEEVFRKQGMPLEDVYYDSLVGMANKAIWEKAKRDFSLTSRVEELMDFHLAVLYNMLESRNIPQPEGMPELLDRVRDLGVHCSLASSSPMKLIDVFVDRLGIGALLDYKVSGEELEKSKPFPDIFLKVSELYGESPDKFWVIEDSAHGVEAAIAAGMHCIGYQNPDSGSQNLENAHIEIDHFEQLSNAVLNKLWK